VRVDGKCRHRNNGLGFFEGDGDVPFFFRSGAVDGESAIAEDVAREGGILGHDLAAGDSARVHPFIEEPDFEAERAGFIHGDLEVRPPLRAEIIRMGTGFPDKARVAALGDLSDDLADGLGRLALGPEERD
jgi:hypothetical protein